MEITKYIYLDHIIFFLKNGDKIIKKTKQKTTVNFQMQDQFFFDYFFLKYIIYIMSINKGKPLKKKYNS